MCCLLKFALSTYFWRNNDTVSAFDAPSLYYFHLTDLVKFIYFHLTHCFSCVSSSIVSTQNQVMNLKSTLPVQLITVITPVGNILAAKCCIIYYRCLSPVLCWTGRAQLVLWAFSLKSAENYTARAVQITPLSWGNFHHFQNDKTRSRPTKKG